MDVVCLGWPPDAPTLALDWRAFPYAGNFVDGSTGKIVARTDADAVIGAVSFDEHRAVEDTLKVRYVSVRRDRQGDGIGPRLLSGVVDAASTAGYDAVDISVNSPFAYEACYKAGFRDAGERTGIAERRLTRPVDGLSDPDPAPYRAGLRTFRGRDHDRSTAAFLAARLRRGPPPSEVVDCGLDGRSNAEENVTDDG